MDCSPLRWRQHVGARRGRVPTPACGIRLALASVLVLIGAAACTDPQPVAGGDEAGAQLCELMPTRAPCREIAVQGRTQRYQLLASSTPTNKAVLVDFGGPGASVLGDNGLATFRAAFPELDAYNLLVLEEPWVVESVPDSCAASLTTFYHALRDSRGVLDAGRAVATACQVGAGRWGFTPAGYRAAVQAVLSHEGLDLTGFVGHSWGGVRLSYLDQVDLSFAVLVRPFPMRAGLTQILPARAELVPAGGAGTVRATSLPTRSLPVTQFDVVSARVALGYLDDSFAGDVRQRIAANDGVAIGELSDRLWGRYGVDSLSAAILAEWDEVCPVTGGLHGGLPPTTTLDGVLGARFAPCGPVAPRTAPSLPGLDRVCIVTSDSDSVTPAGLIRTSYVLPAGTIRWVETKIRSHSSFEGIGDCLRAATP